MNSTERIMATLTGKPLDRRAIAPLLSLYGARLTHCPLEQYYTDPVVYSRGQSAVRKIFQPDVLFSPFTFASIGAAFGGELHFFADQPPNLRRPAIQSVNEWDKVVWPDPETHPGILYFREAIRQMVAEHLGQVPVAAVLPSPIDIPALIIGMEEWLGTVLFDTDKTKHIMDQVLPFFIQLANDVLEDGAMFIALPVAFASPAIVTHKIASDFARPILNTALSQIKGPTVIHHGGEPIIPHLDVLTGLPSTVAFALDHEDNLGQARQVVGPDPVLFGGPCGLNLGNLTVAQVEDECRTILYDRRNDAHFILFTSGADIPLNTPPENIHAIRQAAESFGSVNV